MNDKEDKILKKVSKWEKNKEFYFSTNSNDKCKHYLYKNKDITPQGYGEWMREVWNDSSWKKLLESCYQIKLCGIHYFSNFFKEPVIFTPIATRKIENTLQAYSETFLRLSPYKSHFANIMMENKIKEPCHFRFGGEGNQSNGGSEDFICYIPDKLLNFFVKNFKVCHLSISLSNIKNNSDSEKAGLKRLKKDLKEMGLLEKNDKSDSYLESIIISFYATLTVLKESKKEELFNDNKSIDAIFIPINVGVKQAVIPSLHSRHITQEEISSLQNIYREIFKNFILWENSVSEISEVKKKLNHKFFTLSKILGILKEAHSKQDLDSIKGRVIDAKKLLKQYINREDI